MKLSAVVIAKNEEVKIKRCLESLGFCDEIIIIDDESSDQTVEVAKKQRALVYTKTLNDDFSAIHNFGLEKATGDWILFVDADEEVDQQLAESIKKALNNGIINVKAFFIRRITFWGNTPIKYGEVSNEKIIRLAKHDSGGWQRAVHEQWKIKGRIGLLEGAIIHHHELNLSKMISRINFYSTLHAKANRNEGKKANMLKIIFWPQIKFIYNYVLRLGFLDGVYGFVLAMLMSFHSFLSWSKLWLIQKNFK